MRPPLFFKYASIEGAVAVLRNQTLRWSSPGLLSDPLELRLFPRFASSFTDVVNIYKETLTRAAIGEVALDEDRLTLGAKQDLQTLRTVPSSFLGWQLADVFAPNSEGQENILERKLRECFEHDSARLLCLSTNPLSEHMWMCYGGQASGCVLGFRTLNDSPWLKARPVRYIDTSPILDFGVDFYLYGYTPELLQASIDAVCYTKRRAFEYEGEWRVVTWTWPDEEGLYSDYPFKSDELESVTLGVRVEQELEMLLRSLVKDHYPNCRLYRIVIKGSELIRIPADKI